MFCTSTFIIMNITTLLRITSFSRSQIISHFTICEIVYFITLQKPFNSGRSLPFMPMSLNARTVCFSTFGYYCIVANLSNLNANTAKRLSANQGQKYTYVVLLQVILGKTSKNNYNSTESFCV